MTGNRAKREKTGRYLSAIIQGHFSSEAERQKFARIVRRYGIACLKKIHEAETESVTTPPLSAPQGIRSPIKLFSATPR